MHPITQQVPVFVSSRKIVSSEKMLLNRLSIYHLNPYLFLEIVTSPVRQDVKSQSIQTIAKRSEELTHVFAEKSWDVTQMAQNQNV